MFLRGYVFFIVPNKQQQIATNLIFGCHVLRFVQVTNWLWLCLVLITMSSCYLLSLLNLVASFMSFCPLHWEVPSYCLIINAVFALILSFSFLLNPLHPFLFVFQVSFVLFLSCFAFIPFFYPCCIFAEFNFVGFVLFILSFL